jgi:hypothetical protein
MFQFADSSQVALVGTVSGLETTRRTLRKAPTVLTLFAISRESRPHSLLQSGTIQAANVSTIAETSSGADIATWQCK